MDDSLHYLIMANQMLVQKALLYKLKDTGLTIGQPKILDYLSRHNGSNQKEIAKACFLEAGSLTTILNKMEEKGLIRRSVRKNLLKDEKRQERDYEQIKEVHIIFNRAICKCTGSQSGDKSESWYVTNLIDPICIKPEFPIYTGKFYNRVQYFADRITDSDFKKEF